ncbi:MAG: GNAT family N-acetyltransferase [Labedaea sp.]
MTDLHRATGDQLSVATLYALLMLRVNIFVVEQRTPYPDLDGRDLRPDTTHWWWQPGAEPVTYLRVLTEPGGGARIGRVCTAAPARGAGLSGRLMTAALAEIGPRDVVLDAQVQAQGLYQRFGFEPVGEPFDDDGILHVAMRRPGSSAG